MKNNNHLIGPPSFETLVFHALAEPVVVSTAGGTSKTMSPQECLVRNTFGKALQGDVKAIKQVIKWGEAYLPKRGEDYSLKPGFYMIYNDFDQPEVNSLRKDGYLPDKCPHLLKDIPVRTLNKARTRWLEDCRRGGKKERFH